MKIKKINTYIRYRYRREKLATVIIIITNDIRTRKKTIPSKDDKKKSLSAFRSHRGRKRRGVIMRCSGHYVSFAAGRLIATRTYYRTKWPITFFFFVAKRGFFFF